MQEITFKVKEIVILFIQKFEERYLCYQNRLSSDELSRYLKKIIVSPKFIENYLSICKKTTTLR